ncbi:MAG: ATP-binding protein [Thermoplasmata archaeon]|nr:ATP-binding protein [Thermoplasmata archaeon]
MDVCGQIVYGSFGEILIRAKKDAKIEIGSLLVAGENPAYLLQVYDLEYGSQLEKTHLELTSGLQIENKEKLEFIEGEIQNYVIARAKAVLEVRKDGGRERVGVPKRLPEFFGTVQEVTPEFLSFLEKENEDGVFLGNLRSGSRILPIPVRIPLEESLTHHILITATTGRGKSNLLKVMLASILKTRKCGVLIIDPHDEYFGRSGKGLKDLEGADENLVYYTPHTGNLHARNVRRLLVNAGDIKPWDFGGVVALSDAQSQGMYVLYGKAGEEWLLTLFDEEPEALAGKLGTVQVDTVAALKRKLSFAMERFYGDESKTIFTIQSGLGVNTISEIVTMLTDGKKVVIDASSLSNEAELLLASALARRIFEEYKQRKKDGTLEQSPVVSIVLEEAPRVLRNEESIFSSIAREGRKFRIGLIGVTQLASLIPGEVLANINTKIILGTEMQLERKTLIESASQDISTDAKLIASLEKGEALVTSIFTKFAIPIYAPLFEAAFRQKEKKEKKLLIGY